MQRNLTILLLVCVALAMVCLAPICLMEPCSAAVAKATAEWMQNPNSETERQLAEVRHSVGVQTNIRRAVWAAGVLAVVYGVHRLRRRPAVEHNNVPEATAG